MLTYGTRILGSDASARGSQSAYWRKLPVSLRWRRRFTRRKHNFQIPPAQLTAGCQRVHDMPKGYTLCVRTSSQIGLQGLEHMGLDVPLHFIALRKSK